MDGIAFSFGAGMLSELSKVLKLSTTTIATISSVQLGILIKFILNLFYDDFHSKECITYLVQSHVALSIVMDFELLVFVDA